MRCERTGGWTIEQSQVHWTFPLPWVPKYLSDIINVDDKKFRKTLKAFSSEKGKNTNNMNNYFTNITTHLKLKPTKMDLKENLESIQDHESIQRIKLTIFHPKSSDKF